MTTPVAIFYAQLGENIAHTRKALHMRQGELAAMLGVTRTSVTNIEAGRQKPLVHTVFLIAEVLNCSVDDLLPRDVRFLVPTIEVFDALKALEGKKLSPVDRAFLRTLLASHFDGEGDDGDED